MKRERLFFYRKGAEDAEKERREDENEELLRRL
jgi:hypothetical protein